MNLTTLRIFESAMRNSSFQQAAAENNCSQSSVSFHIRAFENYLNIQLFEKMGRTMRPTKQAHQVLPEVLKILESFSSLEKLKLSQQQLTGSIRIGVSDSILATRMASIFQRFKQLAPNVSILAEANHTAYKLKDKILKDELDLAVTYNIGSYEPHISVLPLDICPLEVLVGASTPLDKNAFLVPGQKIDLPFITANLLNGPSRFFLRFLKKMNISVESEMQVGSADTVRALIKNNIGFTYVPKNAFSRDINEGSIVTVPTLLGPIGLGMVMLKNSNIVETPALSLMSRLVRDRLYNPDIDRTHFIERTCLMNRKDS